jgi:TolB-like protein
MERRLAAVLAADVAGYSRLMGLDEEGTLSRLKAVRNALVDPTIATHRGRIVKTTGDGMLVEFASAVDAVRCAIEVQHGMTAHRLDVPQEKRIEFRIGIHVGDIIIDENDIFGDGVNIAARLEGIAEPGGICVSDDAYRQIRDRVDAAFDDKGEIALKNIARPVRVFAIADATNVTVSPAQSTPTLPLPDKPSIAVLPFQNMSGDPEQEYFADGMVEDIITGLSRSKSLFVIARNSSFTYKGKAVDIKQVGRELGVRYVLEGSVRKSGNRVRITGQLIDAATGAHIWADKFDSDLEDVFELQDRITGSVIGAIAPQLERAEIARSQRKPTENLEAYDYYLRALSYTYSFTKEGNIEALRLAEIAASLDPTFSLAYAMAANSFVQRKAFGWTVDAIAEQAEARRLAQRSIELDQDNPLVLAMAGQVISRVLNEIEDGSALLTRAVALDPNLASARYWAGWSQLYLGNGDAAMEQFVVALRLSPLDSRIFLAQTGMAYAHFLGGRNEEGRSWATLAIQQRPNFPSSQRILCACLAMLGKITEAKSAFALSSRMDPAWSIQKNEHGRWRKPEDLERLTEALRLAGAE